MKCLTKTEVEGLLGQWSVDLSRNARLPWRRQIPTPKDTGRKTALVKGLLLRLPNNAPIVVYVTDWGIWPSSENMALFTFLRAALHEHRPLHEAPGHLIGANEPEVLESLLDVLLYFYWDASIFDEERRFLITLSHDEFIEVACDLELKPAVDELLAEFGADT